MGRVTGKYIGVGYEDGEGKTHPHPSPLSCLVLSQLMNDLNVFFNLPVIGRRGYVNLKYEQEIIDK